MRKVTAVLAVFLLLMSAGVLAQGGDGGATPVPPEQPESILVTVGAPKGSTGYWYGRAPEFEYLTVYSPQLELKTGRQFRAFRTEKDTYRASLESAYVYVYVNP